MTKLRQVSESIFAIRKFMDRRQVDIIPPCGLASVDMPLLVVEFQARVYKMICQAQMNIEHVIPFEKQL